MNKRPEFFVSIIAGAADMPRWLTQDERGTLEEAVCYIQRQNEIATISSSPGSRIVALAILTGEKFSCLLVTPEIAATFEPAVIDAYAVGRASKIVDQVRAVKEAIYMLRRPGTDDVIQAIEDEIDLAEVLRKAGE